MNKQHKWHKEIKAWADGAEIETRIKYGSNWGEWITTQDLIWTECSDVEYRIKPQPKLVPFDFSDAEKLIGKAVKGMLTSSVRLITDISKMGITFGSSGLFRYEELLTEYVFPDGSPCGKYINE